MAGVVTFMNLINEDKAQNLSIQVRLGLNLYAQLPRTEI